MKRQPFQQLLGNEGPVAGGLDVVNGADVWNWALMSFRGGARLDFVSEVPLMTFGVLGAISPMAVQRILGFLKNLRSGSLGTRKMLLHRPR